MNQCLINLFNSFIDFRSCDLFNEYIIREMKQRLRHMLNMNNDAFHREVYDSQVMIAKEIRDHIYKDSSAVKHYQHSFIVKANINVRLITKELLHERVFTRTSRRQY